MAHCGLSPHSCASKDSRVTLIPQSPRIRLDGKTTGGVISNYIFREGPVTIGRIENDPDGSYLFHFDRGQVKPIEPITNKWSSLVFEPESGDDLFSDRQLANHYVFIYEDMIEKIKEFCNINDITKIY